MLFPALAVFFGITLVVLSADKFVDGASNLAVRLGMSHFFIGLTIISVGTSAPELTVSAVAAYEGSPGLALGNALGSNIANIALVLGATAIVCPLVIPEQFIHRELPILVIVEHLNVNDQICVFIHYPPSGFPRPRMGPPTSPPTTTSLST